MMMHTVNVKATRTAYTISIGAGGLNLVGETLKNLREDSSVFIIYDANVSSYIGNLSASLEKEGHSVLGDFAVMPGEASKSYKMFEVAMNAVLGAGVDRHTVIIAFGGGVTGDIAGFVAATCMRGLDFIQIPTTLLSMVDSSVGGKTGINTKAGKNLVGAFHQPIAVIIDTDILETLPLREFKAGYAELVKHAFIKDRELFDWLDQNHEKIFARDKAVLPEAIAKSCAIKAEVVEADEFERANIRALLNFGHTFGHALEAIYGYDGRLLHGEAVALGMVMAFKLSVELGECKNVDAVSALDHMKKCELLCDISDLPVESGLTAQRMVELMAYDKKAEKKSPTFIISEGIGCAVVRKDIEINKVEDMLAQMMEEAR